jgi:superkiller protein 3
MLNQAEAACREAIHIEPSFEEAHYLLGEALRFQSRNDEAIAAYRKAIELDEDYQAAWHGLGWVLTDNMDLLEEGIEALMRAVALRPDDGWPMIKLANTHWKAGRLAEADEWYRKAIAAFPKYEEFKRFYCDFKEKSGI